MLTRELGAAGFLKLTVGDADNRPDVRSLAIARETLACCSGLADFSFAMQGLGSGAISLFGTVEQKRQWLPRRRQRRNHRRLRHDRARMRVGRRQHRHLGAARRRRMGDRRREDLHLQRRHRRFLRDLRAHRRRRRLARPVRLHRPRRRPGPQRRATDRGDRPAPAGAPQIRQCPGARGRPARRAGPGLSHRHGDSQPVPGDGRRRRARLRPAGARRGDCVRPRAGGSALVCSATILSPRQSLPT